MPLRTAQQAPEPELEAEQGSRGWLYGYIALPADHPITAPVPDRTVLMDVHVDGEWRPQLIDGSPPPSHLFHGPRTSHAAWHDGRRLALDRMWRAHQSQCITLNITAQLVPWTCGRGDGVVLVVWHEARLLALVDIAGDNCAAHVVTLTAQMQAGERVHVVVDPRSSDYYDGVLLSVAADAVRC